MKTRIIHSKIWTDSYFIRITAEEKLLFLYYLTNSRVNIIHLYECPIQIVSVETSISPEKIIRAKLKFEKAEKIYYLKDYIYLKNAVKYELYTGELNETAKKKLYSELSKEVLDWYNNLTDTPINTPLIPSITHNTDLISKNLPKGNSSMNENIDPADIPF